MKNIQELENKLNELIKEFEDYKRKIKFSTPTLGEKINIAGIPWIILDKTEQGYLALAEKKIDKRQFGNNNDWKESEIRAYLNDEFAEMIEERIGCSLSEFERDLLSMDGQTEYGSCTDKVSLISVDEYRRYRRFIPNGKDGYWWTITPDSTTCNDDSTYIRVVSPYGNVLSIGYDYYVGVRPLCIFPSSIFESEE